MIVVVMGVTGAGKTTVGRLLAARLDADFLDADDYHPPENVAKMRAGAPLDDEDRRPWLARLNALLRERSGGGRRVVLACSALKAAYRAALLAGVPATRLVFLRGPPELIAARLTARRGHYMNPRLLESQFAALEAPGEAIAVEIEAEPETIVAAVLDRLAVGG